MKIQRFESPADLDTALAARLKQAIEATGGAQAVMLSGGNAPRPAYRILGAQRLQPGESLHLLYSDERYVPSSSEASNYSASLPLLNALRLTEERVLRVRSELPLLAAVENYDRDLRQLLRAGTQLTLGLLGMGADGHTASLFTAEDLARARGQLVIAVRRPDGMQGITVTPEFLEHMENVVLVVTGPEKHSALRSFLARDRHSVAWQALHRCRNLELWTDLTAGYQAAGDGVES